LAKELPPHLLSLIGTVVPNPTSTQAGGKPLFNSMALLGQGKIQQIFHKRLLPTYDVFDEDRYFEPGRQVNHFFLPLPLSTAKYPELTPSSTYHLPVTALNVGVTICEDLWNDEEFWGKRSYRFDPVADLAQVGVDVTINLSASPYTLGKQRLREAMLHHSAVRFCQPLIYVNQVGGNDDLIFDGSSVAFNRQGELVCRARAFSPDLVFVDYDEETRDLIGCGAQAIASLPETDEAELWLALVLGVRDYARKCGFSRVVIGLSGGIDSALVAAIAAEALEPENVLGVLMPSPYSSDHSVADALHLASNLGIRTETLPIGELMQGYDRSLAGLFHDTTFGVAEENIQSRIRGNLLMAIANKFGYLLLSTGNKSEMAVGYCTLYGDMNGGLAAIADVPKTRVYSLCRWLNQQGQRIPETILTKAPSAELKPGQVDQDSLPPYDILDDILARLIHNHQTPDQIVAAGHDAIIVNRVIRLVTLAEFKRRQAPPGLKVTDRAFGTGWRMPIASRWIPSCVLPPPLFTVHP